MSATTGIVTKLYLIAGALPFSMKRISNPYDLADNINPVLTNGFGVIVGEASREDGGTAFGFVTKRRNISLVFTKLFACANSTDSQAEILDRMNLFVAALKKDRSFTSLVVGIEDNGDDGVQLFGGENEKEFIQVTANLSIIYKEVL